ncbi:MAG: NAD(P)/FAD-dependent oxidoreductase [Candidatus Margulisbacteria bacterium]|nr:NAD(P)/FAD-dependent oxidoreductase [Candidatus Margulisiibacteriota bacterium]
MKKYDLIVIGAGPGGYTAAARAAKHGLKTLLIEKTRLGGTCLNSGCIPVKTLLASAHLLQKIQKAGLFNIKVENPALDFPALIDRKDRLIKRMQKGIETLLRDSGAETIFGEARLLPGKIVSTASAEYTADNIILATGGAPGTLPGLEPDGEWLITSEQLLNRKTLPASLAIIGAGVIGLEFADIYSRLGVKVTLIDVLEQLLPAEDREAAALLQKSLERAGCVFLLGRKIEKIADKLICLGGGQTAAADLCLLAAGRRVSADYIQDPAVQKTPGGAVTVAENFETSIPGVYAIGDANNLALYAHAAIYQGRAAVNHILQAKPVAAPAIMPRVIFTAPQIASLGEHTGDCRKMPFNLLGRAQTENQTEGFVKIFLDKDGVIAGCVIVSENADALIGEAVALINTRAKYAGLKNFIHPHPGWAEIFNLQ